MIRKHCSDERLLAHLDGELSTVAKFSVERHLNTCWQCRARSWQLEDQVRSVAEAYRNELFLPSPQVEAARERFLRWASRDARQQSGRRNVLRAMAKSLRAPALGLVSALALAAGLGIWSRAHHRPAPVAATPPVLFSVPRAVAPAASVSRPALPHARLAIPSESPLSSSLDVPASDLLTGAEIQALWVLHEMKLCLENAVEVSRLGATGIAVRGVVASAAVRDQLTARLKDAAVPARIDIRTPQEIAAHAAEQNVLAIETEPVQTGRSPGEELLLAWLRSQPDAGPAGARANAIANEAVRVGEAAWSESWAVRRLAERFPPSRMETLEPLARHAIRSMAADHLEELSNLVKRQNELLTPILRREESASTGQRDGNLFSGVLRMQALTEELFASAEETEYPAEGLATDLAGVLSGLESRLKNPDALASREWTEGGSARVR
ncbi:MAG: hypothetical protein M1436_03825 [Acidobacteria bacterium]|nr:hypothetical protein [Acidobacteriota bacterium]